jgi:hypothetical protein
MQQSRADRMGRSGADARMDRAQESAYGVEHMGAWLFALIAIVLGIIGLLTGLGVVDWRDATSLANIEGIVGDSDAAPVFLRNNFWDGAMLLFSAMTAALVSYCLHASDHHRLRDVSTLSSRERGAWAAEHGLAYVAVLAAIVLVVIGLLTGFNTFSNTHDQGDGLMWIWMGLTSSGLALALHAVRHHQISAEEDVIIAIVEERISATTPTGQVRQTGEASSRM